MDLGWFGGQVGAKMQEKSLPEGSKNQIQVKMTFEGLLERSGVDFGPELGGKSGPSWHQNPQKEGPKMKSKKR